MTDAVDPAFDAKGPFSPGPPPLARSKDAAPTLQDPLVERVPAETGRRILGLAVVLGVAFQLLFVGQGAGVNVLLLTALTLLAGLLARPRGTPFDMADAWLAPMAIVFAAWIAFRADTALIVFDGLAALALTAAALAAFAGIAVTRRSVGGMLALAVRTGGVSVTGAGRLREAAQGVASESRRVGSPARRIAVGLFVALPMAMVFTVLFAQADAVFGQAVGRLLDLQVADALPVRVVAAVVAAWLLAGLLAMVAAAGRRMHRDDAVTPPFRLGSGEGTVALIALDLLFATFVVLQAAYLFGGLDTVAVSGMTYSDYARRGFFELVAVTILVGLLVVAVESIVTERTRTYRAALVALVVLTGAVLVSAAVRLDLYQQMYGWTELRFYVISAIGWLGLCLVAAVGTVVVDRSRWLPHTVAILAIAVAVVVNIVSPQAFVADRDVERALHPESVVPGGVSDFDRDYLRTLGVGAVPAMLAAVPYLEPDTQRRVIAALVRRRDALDERAATQGWPSWNYAREEARRLLNEAALP